MKSAAVREAFQPLSLEADADAERQIFEKHVYPDPTCGCWIWTGAVRKDGYAHIALRGQNTGAHRAMWQFRNGPMPADKIACHSCDTPLCVNPEHVWPGTHAENTADKFAKGRDGHNLYREFLSVRRATVLTACDAVSDPTVPITLAMKIFRQAHKRTSTETADRRLAEMLTARVRGGAFFVPSPTIVGGR